MPSFLSKVIVRRRKRVWRGWAHPIAEQYSISGSVGGSEMGAKAIKD